MRNKETVQHWNKKNLSLYKNHWHFVQKQSITRRLFLLLFVIKHSIWNWLRALNHFKIMIHKKNNNKYSIWLEALNWNDLYWQQRFTMKINKNMKSDYNSMIRMNTMEHEKKPLLQIQMTYNVKWQMVNDLKCWKQYFVLLNWKWWNEMKEKRTSKYTFTNYMKIYGNLFIKHKN